ncbi:MAG: MFS transporter [Methanotrichaceae archaeon]
MPAEGNWTVHWFSALDRNLVLYVTTWIDPMSETQDGNDKNRNILLLGLVSLLNDASSEIIRPILPLFILSLGGGGMVIGLIGGLGDGIPSIFKILSGYWSDRLGRRKPFVIAGYSLSAVTKLFLSLATIWQHVFLLTTLERCGKGIRAAPRDAIIAESAETEKLGRGFGIHRALDTLGAIIGSALAYFLWRASMSFTSIFILAGIIAIIALTPLFPVRDVIKDSNPHLKLSLSSVSPDLRKFILIAALFAMGNFSYMFFLLRARQLFTGDLATGAPLLFYILFNIVYTLFSVPSGIWSDRVGRKNVLTIGYALFAIVCLGFAYVSSVPGLVLLFAFYGLIFAMVDGAERAFVSDQSRSSLRGTALGFYHTAVGVAALLSGIIAGALWQYWSFTATFLFGTMATALASLLLLRVTWYLPDQSSA